MPNRAMIREGVRKLELQANKKRNPAELGLRIIGRAIGEIDQHPELKGNLGELQVRALESVAKAMVARNFHGQSYESALGDYEGEQLNLLKNLARVFTEIGKHSNAADMLEKIPVDADYQPDEEGKYPYLKFLVKLAGEVGTGQFKTSMVRPGAEGLLKTARMFYSLPDAGVGDELGDLETLRLLGLTEGSEIAKSQTMLANAPLHKELALKLQKLEALISQLEAVNEEAAGEVKSKTGIDYEGLRDKIIQLEGELESEEFQSKLSGARHRGESLSDALDTSIQEVNRRLEEHREAQAAEIQALEGDLRSSQEALKKTRNTHRLEQLRIKLKQLESLEGKIDGHEASGEIEEEYEAKHGTLSALVDSEDLESKIDTLGHEEYDRLVSGIEDQVSQAISGAEQHLGVLDGKLSDIDIARGWEERNTRKLENLQAQMAALNDLIALIEKHPGEDAADLADTHKQGYAELEKSLEEADLESEADPFAAHEESIKRALQEAQESLDKLNKGLEEKLGETQDELEKQKKAVRHTEHVTRLLTSLGEFERIIGRIHDEGGERDPHERKLGELQADIEQLKSLVGENAFEQLTAKRNYEDEISQALAAAEQELKRLTSSKLETALSDSHTFSALMSSVVELESIVRQIHSPEYSELEPEEEHGQKATELRRLVEDLRKHIGKGTFETNLASARHGSKTLPNALEEATRAADNHLKELRRRKETPRQNIQKHKELASKLAKLRQIVASIAKHPDAEDIHSETLDKLARIVESDELEDNLRKKPAEFEAFLSKAFEGESLTGALDDAISDANEHLEELEGRRKGELEESRVNEIFQEILRKAGGDAIDASDEEALAATAKRILRELEAEESKKRIIARALVQERRTNADIEESHSDLVLETARKLLDHFDKIGGNVLREYREAGFLPASGPIPKDMIDTIEEAIADQLWSNIHAAVMDGDPEAIGSHIDSHVSITWPDS